LLTGAQPYDAATSTTHATFSDEHNENDNTITSNSPHAHLFKSIVQQQSNPDGSGCASRPVENSVPLAIAEPSPSLREQETSTVKEVETVKPAVAVTSNSNQPPHKRTSIISSIRSTIQQPLSTLSNRNAFKYINRKKEANSKQVVAPAAVEKVVSVLRPAAATVSIMEKDAEEKSASNAAFSEKIEEMAFVDDSFTSSSALTSLPTEPPSSKLD
jgi:hypothetical protein